MADTDNTLREALRPDFMAEVVHAAVLAMQANGLANRTERLEQVRDQLRAVRLAPPAPGGGGGDAVRVLRAQAETFASWLTAKWARYGDNEYRNLAALLRALAATPAPAVDGGDAEWVLVPKKITREMWSAWEESGASGMSSYQQDWDAMLAAAPAPAVGREAEKPIGTITRRDSGNEVLEHEIVLDDAFEESLYRYDAGTVFNLYATPSLDAARAHMERARAELFTTPPAEAREPVGDTVNGSGRDKERQPRGTTSGVSPDYSRPPHLNTPREPVGDAFEAADLLASELGFVVEYARATELRTLSSDACVVLRRANDRAKELKAMLAQPQATPRDAEDAP